MKGNVGARAGPEGFVRISSVVKTGARARALEQVLTRLGYTPVPSPPSPRAADLSPERLRQILDLYRALGGRGLSPQLRPGAWDLAFQGGLVIELDEELHFNRYRRLTLEAEWTARLPWRRDYLVYTVQHEAECLAAARWGRRWTNPSCEAMFGSADPPGMFPSAGASRWKQRALYDAMKDAVALDHPEIRVARLAIVDCLGRVDLAAGLERRSAIDLDALRGLIAQRST